MSLITLGCQQFNLAQNEPESVYATPDLTRANQVTFEVIWQEIATGYLREDFSGTDWDQVHETYAEQVDQTQSAEDFQRLMEKMIAEIPDNSIELKTRQMRIDETLAIAPNRRRIGVFTGVRDAPDEEPRLIILHVQQGSAAAVAGLRPHEVIWAIDGQPIEVGNGELAQENLRTTAGTPLQLQVETPMGERRLVIVTGQPGNRPQASPIDHRILPNSDILYLKFPPDESRESLGELVSAVDQLRARSGENKGIIVDLRVMTGERRSSLLQFLSVLTDGVVFNQIDLDGGSEEIAITGVRSSLQDGRAVPVVVIIGRDTSGTGEIFAAALQDQARAIVIGQPTPGEVEEVIGKFLPNGSQLILPSTTLITANRKRDIGQLGVEPDVYNPVEWDRLTSDNDPLIDLATQTIQDAFINNQP